MGIRVTAKRRPHPEKLSIHLESPPLRDGVSARLRLAATLMVYVHQSRNQRLGRIGTNVVRAGLHNPGVEFVDVNELTDTKALTHLLKYDAILGTLPEDVHVEADAIVAGGKRNRISAVRNPGEIDRL